MKNSLRAHAFAPALSVLSLAVAASLQAQTIELDPVVVTATRFISGPQFLPIASEVISNEEIRDSSAITASDVLNKLGGVHTRINFTGVPDTPIDLRGFGMTGDQNTLVLVNGQRISENENVTARLSAIPVDSIERVEILRGSGAVLYGSGATGGTINIITRSPVNSGLSGNALTVVGGHGLRDIRAGVRFADRYFGLSLNAQRYQNDNYRKNNHSEQEAVSGELHFGSQEDFIILGLNSDDQRARLPGARTEAQLISDRRGSSTPNDFLNSESRIFSIRTQKRMGDLTLALDVGKREKQTQMYTEAWGSSLAKTDVDILTISPRLLLSSKLVGLDNLLTFGVDLADWSYENKTLGGGWNISLDETGRQENQSIYFLNEMKFPKGTRLSIGARREYVEQIHQELLLPRPYSSNDKNLSAYDLAVTQQIGSYISAYARIGHSFRVANIDENRCTSSPCSGILLKPQKSNNSELGMEWRNNGANYRLAFFAMDIEDELHYNRLTYSNMNLSPTKRRGLEVQGKFFIVQTVDVLARYTHTRAQFRQGIYDGIDVAGNDIPLVPKDRISLNFGWQMTPVTRLGFNVTHVGRQIYDNDQANRFRKMPSYTLADIKLGHEVGPWRLAVGVNNLFDRKFYSYAIVNGAYTSFNAYPEDRRNAYVSADYRF
jgi:iron complex outermembrane receptor protein